MKDLSQYNIFSKMPVFQDRSMLVRYLPNTAVKMPNILNELFCFVVNSSCCCFKVCIWNLLLE